MISVYKLILVIILSQINVVSAKADQSHLPKEWLKLLHYIESKPSTFKSLIKDPNFFVNKNDTHPELELNSNITSFKNDPNYPCKFPARAKFLSKKLNSPYKLCESVETWKKLIAAEGLSYVLVGQYVSTPASAFGHSFIIFKNSKKPLNLNQSLNYAAQIPEEIGTYDYITKGLNGGFPGVFDLEPLYLKLQEYSAIENREMWAYDLNFNAFELDQFLNHIWELQNQTIESYYFLNGNCSVSLYNALAAVHPDLEFLDPSHLYVLPVTTIKKIDPISTKRTFIPSLREKIVQGYDQLNNIDQQLFNEFLDDKDLVSKSNTIKTNVSALSDPGFKIRNI